MKKIFSLGLALLISINLFAQNNQNEQSILSPEENDIAFVSKLISSALKNNYEVQAGKIAVNSALGQLYQVKGVTEFKLGASTGIDYGVTPFDPRDPAGIAEYLPSNPPNPKEPVKEFIDANLSRNISTQIFVEKFFSFGLNTKFSYEMVNQNSWKTGRSEFSDGHQQAGNNKGPAHNYGTLSLELSLPLFKSFKNSIAGNQIKEAEAYLSQLTYSLKDKISEVILNVYSAYWQTILARQNYDITRIVRDNLEERLNTMDSLISAGIRSKTDMLELKVNLNEYNVALVDYENKIREADMNLSVLTGVPLEEISSFISPSLTRPAGLSFLSNQPDIKIDDKLLEEYVKSKPDMLALEKAIEQAELEYRIAKAKGLPDFDLNFKIGSTGVQYSDSFGSYFVSPFTNIKGPNIGGALSFKMGLERLETKGLELSAIANLEKARLNYKTSVDKLVLEIKNTAELVNMYRKYLLTADDALEMSMQLYENQKKRFEAGLITVQELYDQDEKIMRAKETYIQTLMKYYTNVVLYKYYNGSLVELTENDSDSFNAMGLVEYK